MHRLSFSGLLSIFSALVLAAPTGAQSTEPYFAALEVGVSARTTLSPVYRSLNSLATPLPPSVRTSPLRLGHRASYTLGGAVAGALIGSIILFAPSRCRETGSMCGLGLPLYAGGGALIGGWLGYQFADQ